jgi:folate-binding protein YgfZ
MRPAGSCPAVHLDKGCYRGHETVARVHTLGKPLAD